MYQYKKFNTEVMNFQVTRSEIVSLQFVSSYCHFPVSSSSSVALLDDVDHPSTVNFDQFLIPLVFIYAFVAL